MYKGIIKVSILLIILVVSCTQKINPVGTGENEDPIPVNLPLDSFNRFISYEDSIKNSNSYNLLIGKYESNTQNNCAISLLKFTALPDSVSMIENTNLSLTVNNRHNFDNINENTLKIGRVVSTNWYETETNYFMPTDSTNWSSSTFSEEDYVLLEDLTYSFTEDSLDISLPSNVVENWISADTTNYGLVLFSETDDSFLELYSSEFSSEHAPSISFDYKVTEDDTLESYYQNVDHDVFIYSSDEQYSIFDSTIKLSNIQPIKSIIQFEIEESLFTDPDILGDYVIEDTTSYLQQLTINSAELVLSSMTEENYPLSGTMYIKPNLVLLDSLQLVNQPILTTDDYTGLTTNSYSDSLGSDEFKIDITSIFQTFLSNEYENNGIVLESLYEDKNFIHQEFKTDEIEIRVIFTPPFIND